MTGTLEVELVEKLVDGLGRRVLGLEVEVTDELGVHHRRRGLRGSDPDDVGGPFGQSVLLGSSVDSIVPPGSCGPLCRIAIFGPRRLARWGRDLCYRSRWGGPCGSSRVAGRRRRHRLRTQSRATRLLLDRNRGLGH